MKTAYKLVALLSPFYLASAHADVPTLNLDIKEITVSGISSGGYMASQFHIAHSDWVSGAGIVAAGPYYCGQNDIKTALSQCVNATTDGFSIAPLVEQLKQWSEQQKVADVKHLKDSRVWLFHGTEDKKVIAEVANELTDFYTTFVDKQNVTYVNDKPFSHVYPTLTTGGDCKTSESPFIGKCDYDAAGQLLAHFNQGLSPRAQATSGQLYSIEQQTLGGESASSLADTGYVYVPESCKQGDSCSLHISFHGCNQNAEAVKDAYTTGTGLNNWADTNNMVVLYPQTKSSMFLPLNPQGCWDWWGYTDEHYATRDGQQIKAVAHMAKQLAEKRS